MNRVKVTIAIFSGLLVFRLFTELPRVLKETGWFENNIPENLFNQLGTAFLMVFCLFFILSKKKIRLPRWFGLLTIILGVGLLFSLINAVYTFNDLGMPLRGIFVVTSRFFLEWILLLFVLNYFSTSDDLDAFFRIFFKPSVILFCFIGLLQLLTSSMTSIQGINRVSGPFGSPNVFAGFLHLFIVLTFYYYDNKRSSTFWLILLAQYIVLFSTGSMAIFLAHILFLLLVAWKEGWIKRKRFYSVFPVLFLLIMAGIIYKGDYIVQRLSILFQPGSFELTPGSSIAWRFQAWAHYISLLKDSIYSWVFGLGIGTQRFIFLNDYPNNLAYIFEAPGTHNDYITLLLDFGIIGLLIFVVLFVTINKRIKVLEKTHSKIYYLRFYFYSILFIMISENYIDQLIMFVFLVTLSAIMNVKRASIHGL